MRTFTALLIGIALGAGGASAAWRLLPSEATPSLYTNANGADALRDPARHMAAAVQYRGTVIGERPLGDGDVVAMRIDGTVVAAHVYDSTWAPAYVGEPLEIQGRIRGALGDPLDAAGIPLSAPLWRGMTLIDVSAAMGPHRLRSSARRRPARSVGRPTAGARCAAARPCATAARTAR